jgi:hypothetical protein
VKVTYKTIAGAKWQWAEDYAYTSAVYVVACPPGRTCQVGMGVFAFDEPRGEKVRFSGDEGKEITVIGAGTLHFRVVDGKGPCRIGFAQKSARPLSWTWSS